LLLLYRPNDRQAIPGFIQVMKQGQSKFQIGDNFNLVDWTYVENCAYAHILAVDKLSVENKIAGEVNIYMIIIIFFIFFF
jgi:sterol-4alpha-carboxylate 3-dehydrogenase (decarboxylating)